MQPDPEPSAEPAVSTLGVPDLDRVFRAESGKAERRFLEERRAALNPPAGPPARTS